MKENTGNAANRICFCGSGKQYQDCCYLPFQPQNESRLEQLNLFEENFDEMLNEVMMQVEQQIVSGEPPETGQTLQRLMDNETMPRENALMLLTTAMSMVMLQSLSEGEEFDEKLYLTYLANLPELPIPDWLKDNSLEVPYQAAIVVTPRKPFFDWVKKNCRRKPAPSEQLIQESCAVYMVDEINDLYDIDTCLAEICEEIFYKEFSNWNPNENTWPKDRDVTNLRRWFDIRCQRSVVDLTIPDEDIFSEDEEDGDYYY